MNQTLTYSGLMDMEKLIPAGMGLKIIQLPLPLVKVPARPHPRKKRRLQKKWLARYGTKDAIDPTVDLMTAYVVKDAVYCYPPAYQLIRQLSEAAKAASFHQGLQLCRFGV